METPQPAPLAVAEEAKRRRDLAGEFDALTGADRDLRLRPWFPIRPGDVVLSYLPPVADSPAYGQTYLAVDDVTDVAGCAMLREVSTTDRPEPSQDLPEYLLVFDEAKAHWTLECPDDETHSDLAPWQDAAHLTDPEGLDPAKAWAAEQIALIENLDENPIQGWKPWPSEQSTQLAAVVEGVWPLGGGPRLTEFYALWFEAGPDVVTVIRAGVVVHGSPARAEAGR